VCKINVVILVLFRILLCSVVKNNVHTMAERVLKLSIVKHDLDPAKPYF
jgi:hypothetical protein